MYNAIDISKYIINKCIDNGNPISNLKLQKLLYYIQGEFLSELGRPAFVENIVAWKHGPVVPEVYYEFNKYIASNINTKIDGIDGEIFKSKKELDIINKVIDEKSRLSAWQLVEKTHKEDPWVKNYSLGQNNIIPIDDIKNSFDNNRGQVCGR